MTVHRFGLLVVLAGCNFSSIFMSGGDDHVPDAGKDGPPPTPALLWVSPTSIALPLTGVGASRAARFTVTNAGGSPSGFISAFATDPSLHVQSTCSALASFGTCIVDATFSPTAAGTLDTDLTISSSPGGTLTVHVSGTAATTPDVLVLSPDPLDFGGVYFNHPVPQRVVTVTNGDSVASGALSVALDATYGTFFIAGDTCTDAVVPPHATCAITLSYGPMSMVEDRAQLTVSGIPGGIAGEMLLGYGFHIDITPHPAAGFAFPATAVGATASQIFTATNGTALTLSVSDAVVANGGPFAVISDSCAGTMLAPGASCTLGVRFAPLASGTTSATLEVYGTMGVGGAFYYGRDAVSGTAP